MVDKSLPSLCIHCGRDLDYTRAHVVTMVLKSEIRVEQTHDTFEDALELAQAPVRERWRAFEAALETSPEKAALAIKQARSGRADELYSLLRIWLDCQDAGEIFDETRKWAKDLEEVLGKPEPKPERPNPKTVLTNPNRAARAAAQRAWDIGGSAGLGSWLAIYAEERTGRRRFETNEYGWWVSQVIGETA